MHRFLFTLFVIAVLLTGCATSHRDFGEPLVDSRTHATVDEVLADPEQYVGEPIHLEGMVVDVCKPKGCWMRLASNPVDDGIFVKFTCPVDGRLIPMAAIGQRAAVSGQLILETVSEADARHLAEDAGQSPEEIAKIVGDQKRLRIQAPGARVWGIEPVAAKPAQATSRPAR